jgi:hypothetical protein
MSNIINYINLQNGHTFSYDGNISTDANIKKGKTPIGARLQYTDINSHTFKIPDNIPDSGMLVKVELRMYEDIGLDIEKSYQISYIQKDASLDGEKLIEAYAIDKEHLTNKYTLALNKTKHIDFIALPFLTFETLYFNKILDPKNDVFIYISKDDAFTTFYKDGKYISSKKIMSISDMVSECDRKKISITAQELEKILAIKGLDRQKYELLEYDLHEYLEETFEALFSKIKSLSLHNRNVYNFSQIDRIFISVAGKPIPQLDSFVNIYTEHAEFKTLNFFASDTIDTLDGISASYIKDKLEQNNNSNNLTFFKRKAPFYKSEVGKLAISTVASVVLLAIYPLYQYNETNNITKQNLVLKLQEKTINSKSKKLKNKLKAINSDIAKIQNQKDINKKKLQTLQDIANSLLTLKAKDSKYTAMLLDINSVLKNYKLSILKIKQSDKHALDIELVSKQNRRDTIALLMKDLLIGGFSSVSSNEIKVNADNTYTSVVTVKR